MTKLFSVLVPAYNVERYIKRCLDSISNQIYTNFEVIIIDDGSRDNTYKICKEYILLDSRFKLFHQNNSGIAATRNRLLSLAQGDWIVFIDADDFVDKKYLYEFELAITKNELTDAIVCDYIQLESQNRSFHVSVPFSDKTDYLNKLLSWHVINTALWAKVIKRSFIEKSGITFEKEIELGEDLCFLSRLLYNANNIIYIPKTLYIWNRCNENSITTNGKKYRNLISLYEKITNFYKKQNDYYLYEKTLNKTLVNLLEFIFILQKDTKWGDLQQLINKNVLSPIFRFRLMIVNRKLYIIGKIIYKIKALLKK